MFGSFGEHTAAEELTRLDPVTEANYKEEEDHGNSESRTMGMETLGMKKTGMGMRRMRKWMKTRTWDGNDHWEPDEWEVEAKVLYSQLLSSFFFLVLEILTRVMTLSIFLIF